MTNGKTALAIAILVFAMAFSLFASPTSAQPGVTLKTYPFVDAIPNPVGLGEQVLIRLGILQQLPSVENGYSGLTVTVTKPDGTTQTLGPFMTDSTGGTATLYTPSAVGTYKLKTNFPEQTWVWGAFFNLEGGNMIFDGTKMQASTSVTIDLVVQQEPLPNYPANPLPSEYWTRPIDPQLREWAPIAGNWVYRPDNAIALYNDDAPETAHVLWAEPLTTGGLTGGYWTDVPASSETGDAYEGKFPNSVVMGGILYYNRDDATVGLAGNGPNGIVAVDLHTGEELWFKNNTELTRGQILYFNSWNYDGVYDYLWEVIGSTWNAYDPFNGEWIYTMTNVPSGVATTYGPSGEILIWQIDVANRWLALWNSTKAGQSNPNFGMLGNQGSWASYMAPLVHGATFAVNGSECYSWNVTIPAGLTYTTSFFSPVMKVYPDRVVSVDKNWTQVRVWALSTLPSNRGTLLFDKTWAAPAEWLAGSNTLHYVGATDYVEDGVLAIWNKELTTHYGFSVETGNYLWATESEHWLDAYGWGNAEHTWYFAYGKLFSVGVGGIVYAYDLATGDTAWTYELTDPYNEPVTGNRWWGWIPVIADGKVYVGHVEHSAEQPLPRGAPLVCLDAETGDVVWRVNGMFRQTRWGGCGVMGDSIFVTMDTYDQRIYAVGKGPTTMTVNAPNVGVPFGTSMMITGTVMDNSPGTKSPEMTLRFANGVPAVTESIMSEWMLYVYKQFARPADCTGVEVTINVVDANGNYREIGKTTSSADGYFSFAWVPDIPGTFYVYAEFAGSKAYYGSHAEAAFVVDEAPEPTVAPTPEPQSLADQYALPGIGITVAAIAIVGAVLGFLLLRKK